MLDRRRSLQVKGWRCADRSIAGPGIVSSRNDRSRRKSRGRPWRREAPDNTWWCSAPGRGKVRRPVDPQPVPLYVNAGMAPELAAAYGPRGPQRARAKP